MEHIHVWCSVLLSGPCRQARESVAHFRYSQVFLSGPYRQARSLQQTIHMYMYIAKSYMLS